MSKVVWPLTLYQNYTSPLLLKRYLSSTQMLMSVQQSVLKILNQQYSTQYYIHRCLPLHLWPCDNKICYHLGSSYSFGKPVYLTWCLSSWISLRLHVVSQAIAAVNTTHFSSITCWHFLKLSCKDCWMTNNWITNQCVNSYISTTLFYLISLPQQYYAS